MTKVDVAVEIGRLFREGQAALLGGGGVTRKRKFSRKLSQSRNDYSAHPNGCHHCRQAFNSGQTRYPIVTSINRGNGWGLASVCMDCFKCASETETSKLDRCQRACRGCGEPMLTVVNARKGRWDVCSNRCYQRDYRKRRRGYLSVVQWKTGPGRYCQCCKKPIRSKRRDAQFCSNACKQWAYRRRGRA